jgi:hypothetical protein
LRPGTSIQSQNQCFQLAAQNDGNLVLYKKSTGQALWSSGTYGRSIQYAIFQSDGNLVIYDPGNRPLWASGTDNKGATRLTLQDDGNLVIYTAQNRPLWATNTVTSCGAAASTTRASKQKVDAFVSRFEGATNIQRYDISNLGGQCVTLIARYLQEYYGVSRSSLTIGNGRDTARSVASQFSGSFLPVSDPGDPIPGSIISFPNSPLSGTCPDGRLCGHVALVVSSLKSGNSLNLTILDSNGDGFALKGTSRVTKRTLSINTSNYSASGYGSGIYWTNPKD